MLGANSGHLATASMRTFKGGQTQSQPRPVRPGAWSVKRSAMLPPNQRAILPLDLLRRRRRRDWFELRSRAGSGSQGGAPGSEPDLEAPALVSGLDDVAVVGQSSGCSPALPTGRPYLAAVTAWISDTTGALRPDPQDHLGPFRASRPSYTSRFCRQGLLPCEASHGPHSDLLGRPDHSEA